MKPHVIFLDVDGVLNSVESNFKFDFNCFNQLKILVEWFDADIVLSSSWRKYPEDIAFLNKALKEKLGIKIVDKTGIDEQKWHRGKEIIDYLNSHSEITDFIIIDDSVNDIIPYLKQYKFIPVKYYCLKTSTITGLTSNDVEQFISLRNKSNETHQ